MAILLALNTLGRLGIVQTFGITDGMPQLLGVALLAVVGATFLLACVGAFFLMGVRARMNWWVLLCTPILGFANIAVAIAVIPQEHVGVGMVLDVYLFNGILPLVVTGLLFKRSARVYFGISRPVAKAKAA
jgi:hypothetical protein